MRVAAAAPPPEVEEEAEAEEEEEPPVLSPMEGGVHRITARGKSTHSAPSPCPFAQSMREVGERPTAPITTMVTLEVEALEAWEEEMESSKSSSSRRRARWEEEEAEELEAEEEEEEPPRPKDRYSMLARRAPSTPPTPLDAPTAGGMAEEGLFAEPIGEANPVRKCSATSCSKKKGGA